MILKDFVITGSFLDLLLILKDILVSFTCIFRKYRGIPLNHNSIISNALPTGPRLLSLKAWESLRLRPAPYGAGLRERLFWFSRIPSEKTFSEVLALPCGVLGRCTSARCGEAPQDVRA